MFTLHCFYAVGSAASVTAAAEALKKLDGGSTLRGGIWGGVLIRGCHPGKIFENIGADLCSMVHFWQPL